MRIFSVNAWHFAASVGVGKWDRFTSWGTKIKDNAETEFNEQTLGQMVDNFANRKNDIAMCYDHQSAYVQDNGQPAPALAFYNALALVVDGKVTKFATHDEKVQPPDSTGLENGIYGYRSELTPLGEKLLPNYRFLSPMFTDQGADEQGNHIGYDLLDVAATNTPFQDGVGMTFHRGATLMRIEVGNVVEISKAYGEDDGYQWVIGRVEDISGSDALLVIKGTGKKVWIPVSRLKVVGAGQMSAFGFSPDSLHVADAGDEKQMGTSQYRHITGDGYYWKCRLCGMTGDNRKDDALEHANDAHPNANPDSVIVDQRRQPFSSTGAGDVQTMAESPSFAVGDRVSATSGSGISRNGVVVEVGPVKSLVSHAPIYVGAGPSNNWYPNSSIKKLSRTASRTIGNGAAKTMADNEKYLLCPYCHESNWSAEEAKRQTGRGDGTMPNHSDEIGRCPGSGKKGKWVYSKSDLSTGAGDIHTMGEQTMKTSSADTPDEPTTMINTLITCKECGKKFDNSWDAVSHAVDVHKITVASGKRPESILF
jgi:hypothetical protein